MEAMTTAEFPPLDPVALHRLLEERPTSPTVASFVPSAHIRRLDHDVDLERLRTACEHVLESTHDQGAGFHTANITRRPGVDEPTVEDLSGRYWIRPDSTSDEVPRDPIVDETAYTEIAPAFAGTYVEEVVRDLQELLPIGRVRLLGKDPFNCNSWHRDPEPRLHIPIITNPGALFVINHHVTHLPADGSVYFTDTRAYHTAMNGGEHQRLSIVAAIAITPETD
jgi:hypothetical protein